jgi:hypothetical protein
MLKRFHQDLERLELRPRRQHDARRTFISLAIADGARKDILRWVTHGPEADIVDLYTTLPWHTLCEEVARLKIDLETAPKTDLRKINQLRDWKMTRIGRFEPDIPLPSKYLKPFAFVARHRPVLMALGAAL